MNASQRLARAAVFVSSVLLVAPFAFPEVARAGVEDAQREVQNIVDELDRLHEQADILAEDYAEAVDQKNQLDVEVAEAEERVRLKEAELAALRGDLGEVAVRAFTGAGTDVLGPLFSSPTQYGAGLQRDQYSRVALSVGTTTTDDLDELISSLDEDKRDLESKRDQVEQLTRTIAQKQEQTEQLREQYLEARAAAEARLGAAIAAEEKRREEAAYRAWLAEQNAAQAAAGGSSNVGGAPAGNSGGGSSGGSGGSSGGGSGGGGSSAPAPVSVPATSGLASVAVQAALGQQGVPYKYATSIPGVNFDCSGLTHYAWGQAGVYLPRNSRAQAAAIPRIPSSAAQPGDLVFYYSPISHVGIYIGNGNYVHAPATGDVVKVSPVRWNKVTAVGRPG